MQIYKSETHIYIQHRFIKQLYKSAMGSQIPNGFTNLVQIWYKSVSQSL